MLNYVVEALSVTIVRTSVDPAPQPWRIRVHADEPHRGLLERQLATILRARAPVDGDAVVCTLEIGAISVWGDTGRLEVRTDVTRRCPGSDAQTTGSGNVYDVVIPRSSRGFWGAARSTRVAHGDRVPCRRLHR